MAECKWDGDWCRTHQGWRSEHPSPRVEKPRVTEDAPPAWAVEKARAVYIAWMKLHALPGEPAIAEEESLFPMIARALADVRRAAIEAALKIVGEFAQELAEIRNPTERQMGAFDAVSALEDEMLSVFSPKAS